MRIWGRVFTAPDEWTWVAVTPDADGFRDDVYLTNLLEVLLLCLGESPFYSNYGIPAQPAVIQQVFPDFYVARTQQLFSQFFASLTISKRDLPTPTYDVKVVTKQGSVISTSVAGNDRYELSRSLG